MTISYLDPLTRAWNRMVLILFQPFDFVKWLVLGFSAWLAGLGSSSGSSGGQWTGSDFDNVDNLGEALEDVGHEIESLFEHVLVLPLVVLGVALLLALVLALLWVSSRGKFIFLDNVVHNRATIVEPWKKYRTLGNSLFLWRVGFAVVILLGFGFMLMLVIAPAIGLAGGGGLRELSLASMLLAGLLAAVAGVGVAYVALFLDSFVVPIMYRYDLKATAAWRALMPWLSSKGGWFLLYGLFVLLLFMLFSVVFLVTCVLTCCILLIPYVGTVLLLPAIVTYRLLSLEFLAQFDPGFDLFQDVEPALPTEGSSED